MRSSIVIPKIGTLGRNRAMDRTVKPDPEIHSSAAKSSSLAALHVAKVIASVIPSEPVDDGSSSGI